MNAKSKITVGVGAVLTLLSITSYAADAPNFGAYQAAKDAQNNPIGLAKGEGVVKDIPPSNAAPQTVKTVDAPTSGVLPPVAALPPAAMPSWSGPSLGDLEKIRSENAMLAEQLKNAELKKKIAEQGGLVHFSGANMPTGSAASKASAGPRVVMIAGGEGNYRANIVLATGQSMTASTGSSVPGFGVVSSITPDAVQFGSGKAKRSLPLITNGANADFVMSQ